MPLSLFSRSVLCALFFTNILFFFIASPLQSESHTNLHEVIKEFGNKIYVLGETTGGSPKEWKQAEEEALSKLRKIANSNPETLIELDKAGNTPLFVASSSGFDFIVAELVKFQPAQEQINTKSTSLGLNAYESASLAIRQTFLACHPKVENPFWLVPRLVTLPYYENRMPYQKILHLLEENGSTNDHDIVRNFWLDNCSTENKAHRRSVKNSTNLTKTLIEISEEILKDM